jgi:hypothetical protein
MKIKDLWLELEEESKSTNVAWLIRLAISQKGYPLYIALDVQNMQRGFLLPVRDSHVPSRGDWPECKGLELSLLVIESEQYLSVKLRDAMFSDVFITLAEDISPRIFTSKTAHEAMGEFICRLKRWQKFLAASKDEWSLEKQRGIWGELHVLRGHLFDSLGTQAALKGWKGPYASHQDFQFSRGALEVKTTSAKQPNNIRITSERQLDDTGVGILLLHVVIVDEREVSPAPDLPGETLDMIIDNVREKICGDSQSISLFNETLLDAGWIDANAYRYERRRYTVRQEITFIVQSGFPRLVEKDIPHGVGDVNYSLAISSCSKFTITENEFQRLLSHIDCETDKV